MFVKFFFKGAQMALWLLLKKKLTWHAKFKFWMRLFVFYFAFEKMYESTGKIVGQTEFSSIGRATGFGEGETQNSKPKKSCSGGPMTHWCTFLLLLAHLKRVTGFTQYFIIMNIVVYIE